MNSQKKKQDQNLRHHEQQPSEMAEDSERKTLDIGIIRY